MIRVGLERGRINTAAIEAEVSDDLSGAMATFSGTVRQDENGSLESLSYEAYEEMALKEMQRICDEAAARFGVRNIAAVHRVGVVPVGESSVFIAVASGHRKEAFRACEFIIDSIKETVTIWKKEIYRDGRGVWVEGAGSK
ncbi:MAG: molybdenum cofactor biosynthesis protein MoaE [Candidatus Thermoplasmatota archaeon]|nr:molybdenum cofactor biosynthesis protein MoaE [Candidatus Thermoplasmatota archaeon]